MSAAAETIDTVGAYRCSFCGVRQDQTGPLLAGLGGAYICRECIEGAWQWLQEQRGRYMPSLAPPAAPHVQTGQSDALGHHEPPPAMLP